MNIISFGLFILIFCMMFGFIKIIKAMPDLVKVFSGIKLILFGWTFDFWVCWIFSIKTEGNMNIIVPIIATIIFIISIIGQKVLKGYILKENMLKEYNKEKDKKWNTDE